VERETNLHADLFLKMDFRVRHRRAGTARQGDTRRAAAAATGTSTEDEHEDQAMHMYMLDTHKY